MIERIEHGNILYALIIKANYKQEGVKFFTENEYAIQMGYMNREKGYAIARHKHKPVTGAQVPGMNQEIIIVRQGRIKVDLYDQQDNPITTVIVESGDIIMFFSGGHGFEILEPSDFIEIKQGPFGGDSEKILF